MNHKIKCKYAHAHQKHEMCGIKCKDSECYLDTQTDAKIDNLYEYISMKKFNKTLPRKEQFCSHANMEGITDAG